MGPAADLKAQIEAKKEEMKTLESTFESEVKKLQETYEKLQKDKEETIAGVKKRRPWSHASRAGREEEGVVNSNNRGANWLPMQSSRCGQENSFEASEVLFL